jgi:predicted glutamine amidotransferase
MAGTIARAFAAVETDYSALNCLLSNGRDLFAIRHYRKWEEYYTLYTYTLPGSIIISSQPVDIPQLKPDNWKPLSNNRLLRISGTPPKIEQIPIAASN